jgi:adenine phosphoribosyltransferase
MQLTDYIRDIPDFPKPGILFKDISPLLGDAAALRTTIARLAGITWGKVDKVAAIESRGFLFGAPLAIELGVGFVPIRKPGKLPWRTNRVEYVLEYGTDAVEMHADALEKDTRVLLVDDVLATGGTMAAASKLVEAAGGIVVGCAFVLELGFLKGRGKLQPRRVEALVATP